MYQNPHYPPGYEDDDEMTPEEFERQQYVQRQQYRQQQILQQAANRKSYFTLKHWLWFCGGLLVLWWLFGSKIDKPVVFDTQPVHLDQTEAYSHVSRQVENTVPLVYTNQDGELKRVLVNHEAYSEFVRIHTDNLEQARERLHQQVKVNLEQRLDEVFGQLHGRINRFADWYFSYSTSYTLLWEGVTSATRHLNSDIGIKEAVAQDLEHYLQVNYQSIVLKPEITDPQLQRAYQQTLDNAHQAYLNILSVMQAEFQVFVAKHTTHVESVSSQKPQLKLDWHSQFNKVGMADYAKGSLGALRGITLATVGAIAGKTLGAEIGKVLLPKLASPFVSKAMTASAGGTTGGTLGSLGGPVGIVAGAGLGISAGLGIDWLINAGIELVNRDEFISDTQAALTTTRSEWQDVLSQSLVQAVDVWFTDTIQLLPKYEQP